ncbi:MAG: sporulation integral membrane protein YtvI [Oscillospiraceae bacterium]|nr:sporulation integral membrane protein YtvI [Oscillospiraceae bacterium]
MDAERLRKGMVLLGTLLAIWLGAKYLLPVLLPFLLGAVLAMAAEPVVRLGVRHLKLPRAVASGAGVSLTLILLVGLLSLLGALAVREIGLLARSLPQMEQTVEQGLVLVQDKLIGFAQNLPEGIRTVMTQNTLELLGNGTVLLQQVTERVPGAVGSLLSWLPDGALGVGTGVLAGFMISVRLPKLRQRIAGRIPEKWRQTSQRVRSSVWQWLKAQGKLMGVTYAIVALGLTVLGVRYGFFWAVLVALVDAVPILGTGTVLIPWAVVELLQGEMLRGIGLVGVYAGAMLTRTVLEPRLVGKHLGLDPLLTLIFLYVGYRFWGIFGMILSPLLAAAAKGLTENPSA